MTRLSEKYFGDLVRQTKNVEDEYINLAIVPAKPRSKHIKEIEKRIARYELQQIIDEIKQNHTQ